MLVCDLLFRPTLPFLFLCVVELWLPACDWFELYCVCVTVVD